MGGENIHVKFQDEGEVKTLNLVHAKGLDAREQIPYAFQDKHITSPAVYLNKRKPTIEDTVVTYSIRERRIIARTATIPGEGESGSLQTVVSGKLVVNPDLLGLKINDKAKFNLSDMKDHIKLNRRFFQSEREYADLLKNLMAFEGKTTTNVKAKSDNQGNASASFDMSTKTAFETFFNLRIPLFDDYEPVVVKVELCYMVYQHGGVDFWFLSDDLEELLDAETERIIKEELKKIEDLNYLILH